MASSSTASPATPKQISVRVVVDSKINRVLYAEAGKDFVDILLSFLTLPLGTIARLVSQDSNMESLRLGCISSLYQSVDILLSFLKLPLGTIAKLVSQDSNMESLRLGCISSLYESVSDLDPKYLNSKTCKQMLLRPRNSMELYNQRLRLNIDDTEPTKFYACEMQHCRLKRYLLVSTFNDKKCQCGKNLNHVLEETISAGPDYTGGGYVREASFVVYDDLNIMPLNLASTLGLLKSLRSKNKIEDFTINIYPKEVMDLLKCSLVSSTVLTDSLLERKQIVENPKAAAFKSVSEMPGKEKKRMKLNVMIEKSKSKVLFAIVDEDFVDQLLSFLAIPLGAVERVLEGNSGLGCIDRLYNSLSTFDESTDFISGKNMFADLKVAPQYNVNKQMLPVSEVMYPPSLYLHYRNPGDPTSTCYLTGYRTIRDLPVSLWDPKNPSTGESSYGYVKRPTMFMVADDLSVKPFSSGVVLSCLNESHVSGPDLEERTICIGVREVVNILKASLISTSALTMALAQFLTNTPTKEDK